MTQTLSEICTFQAAAVECGVLVAPPRHPRAETFQQGSEQQKTTELDTASE